MVGRAAGPHLFRNQPAPALVSEYEQVVAFEIAAATPGNDCFPILAGLIGQLARLLSGHPTHMDSRVIGCQSLLEEIPDGGSAREPATIGCKEDGIRRVKTHYLVQFLGA